MSKSARTVFFFGIYLFITGIVLLTAPNFMLRTFGMPETGEVWIRVVGMLVILLGFYYTQSARREIKDFFRLTVYARATVIFFFAAFVLLGYAESPLMLFGGLDFVGALWTWNALRLEAGA